jgi:hypothetical protein
MTEAMEFAFLKGGDAIDKKRRLDEGGSQTQGSSWAGSSGSTTHTEGGIQTQTALLRITDAIENLELRTRHLETAAYVTLSAPADNVFLTGGLRATKEHKDLVDKQRRRETLLKNERKLEEPRFMWDSIEWRSAANRRHAHTSPTKD